MAKKGTIVTGKKEEELADMMRRGEPLPSGIAFDGGHFRTLSDDEVERAESVAKDERKRAAEAAQRDEDHEEQLAKQSESAPMSATPNQPNAASKETP